MNSYIDTLLTVVDELERHKRVLNLLTNIELDGNTDAVQTLIYMLNERLQNTVNLIKEVIENT